MAPAKMKLRVRKKESRSSSKSSHQQAPETSPDSKCPICLDRFVNVASVERCLHRFCFRCIREWAKNKAECPLCKQPFRSIFHSVRSENDFKEYVVLESGVENAAASSSAAVTTTGTPATPPAGHDDPENGSSRTRRSTAVRVRERRRARNPAPATSSLDEVTLQNLLPWLRRDRVVGASQLRPFLLARTDHILHELVNFARSIEAMECPPAPSYEEDSGSPSSIINISEDADSDEPDVSEVATPERVVSVPVPTSSEISLSQSAWDDETPGPSYSTLSQLQTEAAESGVNPPGAAGGAEEQQNQEEEDKEACMIVGYVKPMAERTPELVQLSSDSSEEEQEKEALTTETPTPLPKVEPVLPVQSAPSPKSLPSTSHTDDRERGAQRHARHRKQDHTREHGLRSRSRSRSSSGSTGVSVNPKKTDGPLPRTFHREAKRRNQHLFFVDSSCDEDHARPPEKSSSSFSPWDSTGNKRTQDERKRRRKTRKRERPRERSRSPRDLRRRRGDRAPRPRSSSTSSSAESRPEKPGGKRKYKTRHLEKRVRHKKKSRGERSPSVEIIYERPASDSHPHSHRWRKSRHKKKSRRRTREQNSPPAIITINSDSSDERHPADHQDLFSEDCLTDSKEKNPDANSWKTDNHKDYVTEFYRRTADFEKRLTDFRDQLIGFQDQSSGAGYNVDPDHQDLKDQSSKSATDNHQVSNGQVSCVAKDAGNSHVRSVHAANDQDYRTDSRDGGGAVSSSTFDHQNHKLSSSAHTTEYSGVTGLTNSFTDLTDRTPESKDHTGGVQSVLVGASGHCSNSKHSVNTIVNQKRGAGSSKRTAKPTKSTAGARENTTEYKECNKEASCHTSDCPERTLGVSSPEVHGHTAPAVTDRAVDLQDEPATAEALKNLSSPSVDTLNLEHFLVDIVNPKPEDIPSGEGCDQRGVGYVPHGDQSQAESDE